MALTTFITKPDGTANVFLPGPVIIHIQGSAGLLTMEVEQFKEEYLVTLIDHGIDPSLPYKYRGCFGFDPAGQFGGWMVDKDGSIKGFKGPTPEVRHARWQATQAATRRRQRALAGNH